MSAQKVSYVLRAAGFVLSVRHWGSPWIRLASRSALHGSGSRDLSLPKHKTESLLRVFGGLPMRWDAKWYMPSFRRPERSLTLPRHGPGVKPANAYSRLNTPWHSKIKPRET